MTRRGQLRRQARRRLSFALEQSPFAFVSGGLSKRYVLGTICVATLFALDLAPAWAQDATWASGLGARRRGQAICRRGKP